MLSNISKSTSLIFLVIAAFHTFGAEEVKEVPLFKLGRKIPISKLSVIPEDEVVLLLRDPIIVRKKRSSLETINNMILHRKALLELMEIVGLVSTEYGRTYMLSLPEAFKYLDILED